MHDTALRDELGQFFAGMGEDVAAVYLFGSQARGEARDASDIDLAVLFREPPEGGLDGPQFEIAARLEQALGRPVDVVVLNQAAPDLCHRVFHDGVLVAEHDRSARVRFEVKRRNEYLDLLPILQRYRRYPRSGAVP